MGCEAIYKRLFETAQDGILILDARTGQVIDANPSLEKLLDYSRAELLGKPVWDMGLLKDADEPQRAFREFMDKRHVCCDNLTLTTKGGLSINVELVGHVHEINQEEVIQCNIRAINQRKNADRMDQRNRRTERMGAIGEFAGGVAHDFNNLIGVIQGYCEILEDRESLPESARKMIFEIHNTGTSARNLAQRLLAFSSGQALQPVALDLNETVSRMEKILGRLLDEDVRLVSLPGSSLGRISADPSEIDQVLMNLVINARDAMRRGGEIVVSTANVEIDETHARQFPSAKPGRYVMLTVSDTGTGMDPETRSHIFEPFFSTKPPEQGTGLGLSTVFRIVEQCGGAIAVDSEPGAGTSFKICFPRCDEVTAAVPRQTAKAVCGGTETILLVDDSVPLRKLMRRFLVDSGFTVLDSGDPAEALRMAAEYPGPIPLMITDRVLPGFSGAVLAERVTAARPETKVIYASGYKDDLVVPSCVPGQDYAILLKPFTQADLLKMARELLDGSMQAARTAQ